MKRKSIEIPNSIEKKQKKDLETFRRAKGDVEKRIPKAYCQLGYCYDMGMGVKQDFKKKE
jgi:TPR repeat protein